MSRSYSSAQLWDPISAFKIINPVRGHQTCVGYAPSQRRRCQNPIAQHNRAAAESILRGLATQSPSFFDMEQDLRSVAGMCLCRHYHQGQVDKMMMEWQSVIHMVATALTESAHRRESRTYINSSSLHGRNDALEVNRPARIVDPGRATRNRPILAPPATQSYLPTRRAIAPSVAPIPLSAPTTRRIIYAPAPFQNVPLSARLTPSTATLSTSDLELRTDMSRTNTDTSISSAASSSSSVASTTIYTPSTSSASSSIRQSSVSSSSTVQPIPSPNPAVVPTNTAVATPPNTTRPCTTTHVARRSTDADCPICTTSLVNSQLRDIVWCKRTCGQNVHRQCMDQWSQVSGRGTRCVVCRSLWDTTCGHDNTPPIFSIWTEEDLGLDTLFGRVYVSLW
ncbi:hypothetical protein EJ08DRAFT_49777 [Tothia fuscella]|uniref:RING-type domain-containing protein n=1 Tax=Tothia fuscella TaxID=1048955 RepID=A0A9P4TS31_9PEZI|nr:hypothetical protein EJ08DRAFT_49777 [Tothia fuscella]